MTYHSQNVSIVDACALCSASKNEGLQKTSLHLFETKVR